MTTERATARYFKVLIPAMIVYMAASLGMAWIDDHFVVPRFLLYGLATPAVLAVLAVFWAHWRLMRELDEFLRMIQVKAVLIGLAVVLAIASGWGWLELYADVPALPVFWLTPIFCVAYGIAATVITKRLGGVF
jgi:hypothetical protein